MSERRARKLSRLVASLINVVFAAGVAVLVNVWTSGWSISVGVGLAVGVIGQGLVLWWTTSRDDDLVLPKVDADADLGKIVNSSATGVTTNPDTPRNITAKLKASEVRNSTFVGVDLTGRPPAPRPDARVRRPRERPR